MRVQMTMRLCVMVCTVLSLALAVRGQGAAKPAKPAQNSSNSVPLKASSTVSTCIHVEAVLLARKPAAMLFGGFVANNYAVVKTTVSNSCDDRQFILHDIYFDYSHWALSGVYPDATDTECPSSGNPSSGNSPPAESKDSGQAGKTSDTGADETGTGDAGKTNNPGAQTDTSSTAQRNLPPDSTIKANCPGQVATVGALDIQDQDTEDAVWSPRNKMVKALTLVGQVASGFAFIWSGDPAKGIGAYNSAFVENLDKLWPDRRINQEKNILALGYRTDLSTAIAKDDHGSFYAFFPLKVFLSPTLTRIFLDSPAMFLNPAEALVESKVGKPSNGSHISTSEYREIENLSNLLMDLTAAIKKQNGENSPPDATQVLTELAAPCPGQNCPYEPGSSAWKQVIEEKYLFKHASLNSVQIVVRGVMTVSVDSIPPTIDSVEFDNEKEGASLWTVSAAAPAGGVAHPAAGTSSAKCHARTGTITGKFLSDGTPSIEALTIPNEPNAKQPDYIGPVKADTAKASDTSLPFTMDLCNSLTNGSKLTFMVTRKLPVSSSDSAGNSSGSGKQVTSNKYVYTIIFDTSKTPAPTAAPEISDIVMDNETKLDVWQKAATLPGAVTGTDLTGGTLTPTGLEVGGKTTSVKLYIGTIATKSSTATKLDFDLPLLKPIPDGSKITFTVETKPGGVTQTSKPFNYPVKKPAAKAPARAKPQTPQNRRNN